ncbi:MAG: L-threonylcarbamoyladenylate synthase, partial [Pseudomonadota bacterium]
MKSRQTITLRPDHDGVVQAAGFLAQGGLVAFPTETVYGLGADASSDQAVAALYKAKGRPEFNHLIAHVADTAAAATFATFNAVAERLATAFWPGALTLVLPLRADARISKLATAGLQTVAVRVPDHRLARELLKVARCPIAAPSANPSGRVSPTTAAHVLAGLAGRIDAVIDDGACQVGVEST